MTLDTFRAAALGEEEDLGALGPVRVEADLVGDEGAVLVERLGRDARTERHGRDAARLCTRNTVEACLDQELRHLR